MHIEFYRVIKNITERALLLSNMTTFHKGSALSTLLNFLVEMQPKEGEGIAQCITSVASLVLLLHKIWPSLTAL